MVETISWKIFLSVTASNDRVDLNWPQKGRWRKYTNLHARKFAKFSHPILTTELSWIKSKLRNKILNINGTRDCLIFEKIKNNRRISTSWISRLVSSLLWHFQVRIPILVHSLYMEDILEIFKIMGLFSKIWRGR